MSRTLAILAWSIVALVVAAAGILYGLAPDVVPREGRVWDAINLAVGVPAFVVAIVAARRGSRRGRLAVAGFALYFAYVHVQYATMLARSPLFVAHVATLALALGALVASLAEIDPVDVRLHLARGFPRRLFTAFAFLMAAALVTLWALRIGGVLQSGTFPPELDGVTPLVSLAIDLGVLVPLGVVTGILIRRDQAWGYVLGALLLTVGFMMFLAIPAWIAVPLIEDGTIRPIEAAPLLILSAIGVFLAIAFLRGVRAEPARSPPPPPDRPAWSSARSG